MNEHEVVSGEAWIRARKALLAKEKELTRLRDEVSRMRRELPWEKVDKAYAFDTTKGERSLADLFAGKSQLVVYHFMFDPAWDEGCKICSFWADNFERNVVHLAARDVTLIAVSRAPLAKLEAYRQRMGWTFEWVSSGRCGFNEDYQVTISKEALERGEAVYNYARARFAGENPGTSVFYKDDDGAVYHTYSCYARGLDGANAAYQYLDLCPKGRDEGLLGFPMEWVRRRDSY